MSPFFPPPGPREDGKMRDLRNKVAYLFFERNPNVKIGQIIMQCHFRLSRQIARNRKVKGKNKGFNSPGGMRISVGNPVQSKINTTRDI